ncbi:uncharacterized protein An01g02220, partial [Aspergillus niger]|uniref:tRNA-splicing endonuclease subunit Sen34 n=2 Tax=Aspergillus niger TaxID=5061 RepID=A2Q7W9_ASPNC
MDIEPTLPIPISYIGGSYFLFSIDAVTYVRREYHICGVLSGTLPQIPQQNVFLGLPLKLMPEEARLLVEKGVACIVDEVKVQKDGMRALMEEDRKKYLRELESQGQHAMRLQNDRKEQQREKALKKIEEKKAAKAKKSAERQQEQQPAPLNNEAAAQDPVVDLFANDQEATASDVPSSYPLFAHLHSEGYFLSPGLRFGCQYLAYPGDPLRFHSHFLSVSADWDEELDLMSIVAGGRLGTGVKKGFLIGGAEKKIEGSDAGDPSSVRTFSIEWGGM